ncbi:MAG: hypothetical protein KAJ92_00535 [Gammaproteobacteria bacterium]|nr:hypothetical protein [Gammaproteobacteria bacterium]
MSRFFHGIDAKELKRGLMLRFTLLLSIFMILLSVSYVIFSISISDNQNDRILLDVAGRQRMQIYQYSSEINYVLIGLATSNFKMAFEEKKEVDIMSKRFEEIHNTIINGGEIVINTAASDHEDVTDILKANHLVIFPLTNKKIRDQLELVGKEWQELKRIALLSLRSDTHSILGSRFVHQLLDQATKAVAEMDHVVKLMQDDNAMKLKQLNNLVIAMVVIGAVLFLMIIYYVYSRIVLPLGSSIGNLQHTMENLEVEKMRAEKANQAKSEFLSSMSHELRTPMNAILGFGQILELDAEDLNEVQRDNVKEILDAGHHLLLLINDVLDLAKVESGELQVSMEKVHIDDLLHQCITLVAAQAEARQLELIDRISCNGYIVSADFTRLKQVMLNLLSNAVKYNHEQGSITLGCEITSDQRICIRVTDTGGGLTENEIAKLFTTFERLNVEHNVEGTGIGLVITKHLVELMGGSIGVESTPGEGSTFWIELNLFEQA